MEIKLSDFGENIERAHIAQWLVSEGSTVKKDQDILEVVTDKASFVVAAPTGGIIAMKITEGAEVKKDDILAIINDRG